MYFFSQDAISRLNEAGWHEGRTVNVEEFSDFYRREGFTVLRQSLDFLSHFGKLRVWRPLPSGIWDTFITDLTDCNGLIPENVLMTSERIGEVLSPVGECGDGFESILVSTSNRFYLDGNGKILYLGDSAEQALNVLLTEKWYDLEPISR